MSCLKHRGETWLPEGLHHGLSIVRRPTGRGINLQARGGKKIILHTTEGSNFAVMDSVLRGKRAEPHLLIGKVGAGYHVIQYIPFNEGSLSLEHPLGTLPTNGGGDSVIQIEFAGFAVDKRRGVHDLSPEDYEALYKLIAMIQNRVAVPSRRPRRFYGAGLARRMTQRGFIKAAGILGHEHVPSQPSGHWDPGAIRGSSLVGLLKRDPLKIKEC